MDLYYIIFIIIFLIYLFTRIKIYNQTKHNIKLLHKNNNDLYIENDNLKNNNKDYRLIIKNLKHQIYKLRLENNNLNTYTHLSRVLPPG